MRKLLIGVAALALTVLAAEPAFAHVTVSPKSATRGSFSQLTFNVPNEEDAAKTIKLEVFFPDDAPLAFASVKPVPGWTAQVEKRHLSKPVQSDDGAVTDVVSKITWTGGEIGQGEFQQFVISAGPLPDTGDAVTFKAIQTYDNGDIVRWIDPIPASGKEPAHPAPRLELTAADAASGTSSAKDSDGLAIGLGVAGVVVGLAAAGLAISARKQD
ncbi:MAG TPA: YcnI family protein [Acidimicrobiales bacterium]|nr:YcnI family protein [Acidimicrobiales bacterium]